MAYLWYRKFGLDTDYCADDIGKALVNWNQQLPSCYCFAKSGRITYKNCCCITKCVYNLNAYFIQILNIGVLATRFTIWKILILKKKKKKRQVVYAQQWSFFHHVLLGVFLIQIQSALDVSHQITANKSYYKESICRRRKQGCYKHSSNIPTV